MLVEYDTEVRAFYVWVTDEVVVRTVELSDDVNVDVDADDNVVGVEVLCLPTAVTAEERAALEARYPAAVSALIEVERLTRLTA